MVTSSAVVGSSAISSVGPQAVPARPSPAGACRPTADGDTPALTRSTSGIPTYASRPRNLEGVRPSDPGAHRGRTASGHRGVDRVERRRGFWNTIAIRVPRRSRIRGGIDLAAPCHRTARWPGRARAWATAPSPTGRSPSCHNRSRRRPDDFPARASRSSRRRWVERGQASGTRAAGRDGASGALPPFLPALPRIQDPAQHVAHEVKGDTS